MQDPRTSVNLFLATAEQYGEFVFEPEIRLTPNAISPVLALNGLIGVDVHISIRQLEILKDAIGAFLDAEAEKNNAVASAVIDEAVCEVANESSAA